jgi:two-component system, OmpR family, sensor kinase
MTSLRNTLLAWLLGAVVVVGAGGAWVSYRHALDEANAYFDYHLRETAMLLRDQAYGFAPEPGLPDAVPAYDFVVQVWTLDGLRIYQSRQHTVLPGLTQLGLSTVETSNGRWRVFGVTARGRVIQVAQPMGVREQRAARLALSTLQPFAFLLPALALLIAWIVGRSVRPVRAFSTELRRRAPASLEPLVDTGLPEEIQPVVTSLNELLGKLRESIDRERAFIADAAHELRTPLTALSLQVDELAAAPTASERQAAIDSLRAGVARAARLVEQLLALAREERGGQRPKQPVALGALAREVVAELLPLADRRGIDVGVDCSEELTVAGEPDSLHVLLRNLVDNAIRHTPEGSRVDVVVERGTRPGRVLLCVTDNGPGIPPAERERVFDRFHRPAGSRTSGSGLGLALVQSIARHHGAEVSLGDPPDGGGLRVQVEFPGP